MFEKSFEDNYKSVVVLANPKTYLNAKFAKKEIKNQVIRADQLIAYIKEKDGMIKEAAMSAEAMLKLARFYLENSKSDRSDYAKRYEEIAAGLRGHEEPESKMPKETEGKEPQIVTDIVSTGREECINKLKAFRLEQSRKEKLKPYYIFNDAQMEDLLSKNPQDKEALMKVSRFGAVKAEKYGAEILKILQGYSIAINK